MHSYLFIPITCSGICGKWNRFYRVFVTHLFLGFMLYQLLLRDTFDSLVDG